MPMQKTSKETYINKFNEIHNFKYDYSKSIFNKLQDKFEYECPIHGIRSQYIKNHIEVGCSACLKDKQKEERQIDFINKSNEKFKNNFTYNKVKYIDNKTYVTVTCHIHGDISVIPHTFLSSIHGCNQCSWKHAGITNRLTKDEMITKANEIHESKYNYEHVVFEIQSDKVVIECPIHGLFKQGVDRHLQGHGCKKCGSALAGSKTNLGLDTFIERSKEKHNNKYTYEHITKYINNNTKYKINCPQHGLFEQRANDHLSGQGCPDCARLINVYSRESYIKSFKNRVCIFYVLECFNENEKFYKIGITSMSIKRRYKSKGEMPYNYNVILELKGTPDYVWDLEMKLKKELKDKYTPLIPFAGSITECYLNKNELITS